MCLQKIIIMMNMLIRLEEVKTQFKKKGTIKKRLLEYSVHMCSVQCTLKVYSTVSTCVQYSEHSECTVQCPHVYSTVYKQNVSTVYTQSVQYSIHMCIVQ